MKKSIVFCNSFTGKMPKAVMGAALAAYAVLGQTTIAYASNPQTGVTKVDNGISKLITLMTTLVAAYGIILLIKNAVEFFSALQDRDSGTMKQAGLGMLSGFCIAAVGSIITFLGF